MGNTVVKDYFIYECCFQTKEILTKYLIVYKITCCNTKLHFLPHVVYFCRAPAYRFANLHIRRILVIFGTYCCIISENPISAAQSFVNLHFCDISVISATR